MKHPRDAGIRRCGRVSATTRVNFLTNHLTPVRFNTDQGATFTIQIFMFTLMEQAIMISMDGRDR